MSPSRPSADARRCTGAVLVIAVLSSIACGGSGGTDSTGTPSSPPPNVQPLTVDGGPTGDSGNAPFTTITVCVPGGAQCQTIGGILVDTGSSGLRLFSSVLTVSLPRVGAGGATLGECAQFEDGFIWGPVATADLTIAGEKAQSLPVQIGGAADFVSAPAACANAGLASESTVADFGANGVLGVGPFREDCGPACAFEAVSPPVYYTCDAGGACQPRTLPLIQQVANPVARFSSDNNGTILDLPEVTSSGAPSVTGSLIFGIGTRVNNALGGASVFPLDDVGNLTTVFRGTAYPSFVDSGSNALYFLDASTVGMPTCQDADGFYCPTSTLALTASLSGTDGISRSISFDIGNADALFARNAAALDSLGGPSPGTFDWGLPFFLGRRVFTAIEGETTPGGIGPYIAY
jgi:Protein of unknown function (DUF3443)